MTLTNNNATSTNTNATSINNSATSRTLATTDAANPRFYNDRKGATAQKGNPNGHIIRWAEDSGNAGATGFRWDVFLSHSRGPTRKRRSLVPGEPQAVRAGEVIRRAQVGYVDIDGICGRTRTEQLAAVPGTVGDGGKKTINNVDGAVSPGAAPTKVSTDFLMAALPVRARRRLPLPRTTAEKSAAAWRK